MDHKALDRSSGMWLLSAVVTAGALFSSINWLSALIGGVAAALLYYLRLHLPRALLPAPIRAVQVLWLAVPLAILAKAAGALFPDASNAFYVPAVSLALSWLLARHPRNSVLACCAVVGFFVLGAVVIVSVFALPELQLRWLWPEISWPEILIALSIGAVGMLLGAACPAATPTAAWRWTAFASPAVLACVVTGNLSAALAAQQRVPFYTLSRSISLFGVVERFEALIAACLTLGICSACALIFHAARRMTPERGSDGVTAALLLVALALGTLQVSPILPAAGTVLLWVLLPLIPTSPK